MKSILEQFIDNPVELPAELLDSFTPSPIAAPYLVSCFNKPELLYLSAEFESVMGYPCERLMKEGPAFLFSIIHPADITAVVNAIRKAQYDLATENTMAPQPMLLEYRIVKKDETIVWIREIKYIVSYKEGRKDHILGCFHDISLEKANEAAVIQTVLQNERSINQLLDVAVSYQQEEADNAADTCKLSGREKEVLRLIADGSSSKQIASKLFISENTVETHRRHLLKKFNVGNSNALVKEAYRRFLLR